MVAPFQEASADRSRPGTRLAKAHKGGTLPLHPHSEMLAAPASAAAVRRDRRNKRGGGAITDTTIRCGCDEAGWAICASDVGFAEVCQAFGAQTGRALPRAAAREEATDDQHGPVRSGVARKHFDFTSRVATPSTRERAAL